MSRIELESLNDILLIDTRVFQTCTSGTNRQTRYYPSVGTSTCASLGATV